MKTAVENGDDGVDEDVVTDVQVTRTGARTSLRSLLFQSLLPSSTGATEQARQEGRRVVRGDSLQQAWGTVEVAGESLAKSPALEPQFPIHTLCDPR